MFSQGMEVQDDKVIYMISRPGEQPWSITFPRAVSDFLVRHVRDVVDWVIRERDMIVAAYVNSGAPGQLSQRAIGDIIRSDAASLFLQVEEGI